MKCECHVFTAFNKLVIKKREEGMPMAVGQLHRNSGLAVLVVTLGPVTSASLGVF